MSFMSFPGATLGLLRQDPVNGGTTYDYSQAFSLAINTAVVFTFPATSRVLTVQNKYSGSPGSSIYIAWGIGNSPRNATTGDFQLLAGSTFSEILAADWISVANDAVGSVNINGSSGPNIVLFSAR